MSVRIALLASGIFLLTGLITGVWKYAKIMASAEHRAPVYVDIAHRASFFYAFASLIIAKLIEFSPFGAGIQTLIVAIPLSFFAMTIAGYIREGMLNRTENMFAERTFTTTTFMYVLIAGEIVPTALIVGGFIYTQFIQ